MWSCWVILECCQKHLRVAANVWIKTFFRTEHDFTAVWQAGIRVCASILCFYVVVLCLGCGNGSNPDIVITVNQRKFWQSAVSGTDRPSLASPGHRLARFQSMGLCFTHLSHPHHVHTPHTHTTYTHRVHTHSQMQLLLVWSWIREG